MPDRRIALTPNTKDAILAQISAMPPEARREVSAAWLASVEAAPEDDVWLFGYVAHDRATGAVVGTGGFKAPPSSTGAVEIAYGIEPECQGRGFATEVAAALVDVARASGQVRTVLAHTLPAGAASARVLEKNGFMRVGTVMDADDGEVWRWRLDIEGA